MAFLASQISLFSGESPVAPFLWLILLLGVGSLVLGAARFLFLISSSLPNAEFFMDEVCSLLTKDAYEASMKLCDEQKKAAAVTVIRAGINEIGKGIIAIRQSMEETSGRAVTRLQSRTDGLAVAAWLAVVLGAAGAIWGMAAGLYELGRPEFTGIGRASFLAIRLSQAGFVAVLGILVGTLSLLLHRICLTLASTIIRQINAFSLRVNNIMVEKTSKVHKYHLAASQIKEGVGLHISRTGIKVFSDNKLIKEIVI
jgi:biopolymer transport protein ExbB/TolQ